MRSDIIILDFSQDYNFHWSFSKALNTFTGTDMLRIHFFLIIWQIPAYKTWLGSRMCYIYCILMYLQKHLNKLFVNNKLKLVKNWISTIVVLSFKIEYINTWGSALKEPL